MANAKKCDCCKKFFDPLHPDTGMLDYPDEMVRFRNPVFQSSESIKSGVVDRYLIVDSPDCWVDLCPICTAKFRRFMNGEENE
jgi:hypothetical protein